MAYRSNINDFRAEVAARTNATGTRVYTTTLKAGGAISVSLNGTVVYPDVFWSLNGPACAFTDAGGGNQDVVRFQGQDGNWGAGSAEQFIRSLV